MSCGSCETPPTGPVGANASTVRALLRGLVLSVTTFPEGTLNVVVETVVRAYSVLLFAGVTLRLLRRRPLVVPGLGSAAAGDAKYAGVVP